jgi:hypothetical protein
VPSLFSLLLLLLLLTQGHPLAPSVQYPWPSTYQYHSANVLTLQDLVPVDVTGSCTGLSPSTGLAGKTVIVKNGNVCRGAGDNLVTLLAAVAHTGPVRAVIGMDDAGGDAIPPNYALQPVPLHTPAALRSRWQSDGSSSSSIFCAPTAWTSHLATSVASHPGAHLALTMEADTLSEGVPSPSTEVVPAGHMNYYVYEHPRSGEPLQVTVTPLFGNPDLYLTSAADLSSRLVQGMARMGADELHRAVKV